MRAPRARRGARAAPRPLPPRRARPARGRPACSQAPRGGAARAEPARRPRGAAGADAAERALALLGQRQSDAAAVGLARGPGDEAIVLEPRYALRQCGGEDALLGGELADGDAGRLLDRDEQADLVRRYPGDPLLAKLAAEAE